MLDAHLDGTLDGADLESFQAALDDDESLRREVQEHERMVAALQRSFTPPSDEAIAQMLPDETPRTATPTRRLPGWLAAAAGLALLVAGGWLVWNALGPASKSPYGPWRSLEVVYHDTVEAGFEPEWACESDEEFMNTFRDHFRQKLLVGDLPPESRTLGLAYCNSITNQTVSLLARVRERPVMVFIDRLDHDRQWTDPEDGDLHMFRRELGEIVLYEITPWEQPALLDRFSTPQPGQGRESE